MTTLYYAVGGGLGHITRARRVLDALAITSESAIVTSSDAPCALRTIRVAEGDCIPEVIHRERPERLIVDAFPAGIRGELVGVDVPRIDYVARRLRWREYRRICTEDVRFDTTYVVEELEHEHHCWIVGQSKSVQTLDLEPRHETEAVADFWLIVHSGPAEEVRDLMDYARELAATRGESPRMLVATKCQIDLPQGFERTNDVPYASAARIISAAGFNVMLETKQWAAKHHIVPFPRRFDDQFARAAARRRCLACS